MAAMRYTRFRIEPRVAEVLGRLSGMAAGEDLTDRLARLVELAPPSPRDAAPIEALRAHQWVLDHAAEGGLPLTAAGYLKPVDVVALAQVLPRMQDWRWAVTREVDVHPLHLFRESMQSSGLLRKYKGTLVLTKAGQQVRSDSAKLWLHLRDRLVPTKPAFDETAGIVILIHAATTQDDRLNMNMVADVMGLLGWAHSGGRSVSADDLWPVCNDLWARVGNVGPGGGRGVMERTPSSEALSLIRDALVDEAPGSRSDRRSAVDRLRPGRSPV